MRRDVRLLLVGDGKVHNNIIKLFIYFKFFGLEGVGKSTIITSLLTESFTENVHFKAHFNNDFQLF